MSVYCGRTGTFPRHGFPAVLLKRQHVGENKAKCASGAVGKGLALTRQACGFEPRILDSRTAQELWCVLDTLQQLT